MRRGSLLALGRPMNGRDFAIAAAGLLLLEAAVKVAMLGLRDLPVPAMLFSLASSSLLSSPASSMTDGELLVWLALGLGTSLLTTVLALRRAIDSGTGQFVAAMAMIPLLRLPLVVYLALRPTVPPVSTPPAPSAMQGTHRWIDAAAAVFVGAGITVSAVAIGALLFGSYQFGLFMFAPFCIGVAAGYLVNRRGDVGMGPTARFVWLSTLVGSLALLALALEGIICIVVIAPLAFVVAWFGGVVGRELGRHLTRPRANAFGGLLLLPLALGSDSIMERPLAFEVQSEIEIAAPPAAVWSALVHMKSIREEPGLVFRLGVAYPVRGETFGEGVGATRHGEFSTGTAVERVTVWVEHRELAFEVLSEPPSMRELSFYDEVHAPHVHGYFSTAGGTFRLVAGEDGSTRLIEHTRHSVRLEPFAYWLPPARWVVRQNQERVLRHIKREAERADPGARVQF